MTDVVHRVSWWGCTVAWRPAGAKIVAAWASSVSHPPDRFGTCLHWRPMNTSPTTADALPLHVRHWPAAAPARGTVLIVHGLGEHIGRYVHVAQHLNGLGWNVVGYDHRGHGRSGGAKGRLNGSDDFLHDLT